MQYFQDFSLLWTLSSQRFLFRSPQLFPDPFDFRSSSFQALLSKLCDFQSSAFFEAPRFLKLCSLRLCSFLKLCALEAPFCGNTALRMRPALLVILIITKPFAPSFPQFPSAFVLTPLFERSVLYSWAFGLLIQALYSGLHDSKKFLAILRSPSRFLFMLFSPLCSSITDSLDQATTSTLMKKRLLASKHDSMSALHRLGTNFLEKASMMTGKSVTTWLSGGGQTLRPSCIPFCLLMSHDPRSARSSIFYNSRRAVCSPP